MVVAAEMGMCLRLQASAAQQCEAAVADLQQQLGAAHAHVQQLQRQLADLVDSHAQELDQVRAGHTGDLVATVCWQECVCLCCAARAGDL